MMNTISFETVFNTSLIGNLKVYCIDLTSYIIHSLALHTESQAKTLLAAVEGLPDAFQCDEFQWKLLKVFTSILFLNLVLIFIAWKIFGKRICERFMKPGTC